MLFVNSLEGVQADNTVQRPNDIISIFVNT